MQKASRQIAVLRHKASPDIRLIYDPLDQDDLADEEVRLRILHFEPHKIAGEIRGRKIFLRQAVKRELDQSFHEQCILIYLALKRN